MSFARHSMPAEPDDDAARPLAAQREAIALVVNALARISLPPVQRGFVVAAQATRGCLADHERQRVLVLAWRHRRQMPAHLAPKTNPDDPLSPERAVPWKDHLDG